MEETTTAANNNNNNNNNNNHQGHGGAGAGVGRHSLLTRSVGQVDVSMSTAQQIYQNEPDQTSKNKRLLTMGLGIEGCNVFEKPFKSAADKKRFTPQKKDWQREADRRFALRGERARLNNDRVKADTNIAEIKEWLLNHPLEDPADVQFIQRKVAELKQTLRQSPQKRAKKALQVALQRTSQKAKAKVHDAVQHRVDVGMESLGYLSALWSLPSTRRASSSTTTFKNDAPQPLSPQPQANHARPEHNNNDDALGDRIPSVVGSNERGHRFSVPHYISDCSVLSPSLQAIIQPWVHDNDYNNNNNDDDDDSDDDNEEDDTMGTFGPDKSLGSLTGIGSKSFFSSSGKQILSFRSSKRTPFSSSSSSFGSRSLGSSFSLMDISVVRTPSSTTTAANNDNDDNSSRPGAFSWSSASLARDSNSRHLEQKDNFEDDDHHHHDMHAQQQQSTTMMEEDASHAKRLQQQHCVFQELVTDPEYRVSEVTRSFQQCTGLVSRTPSVEDLSQWSGQLSIGGGRSLDVSMVSYRSKCPYSNYNNNNNNYDVDGGIGSSSSVQRFWAEC